MESSRSVNPVSSASDTNGAQLKYMGTYVSRSPSRPNSAAPLITCSSLRLPPPAAHFLVPPLPSSFPSHLHPHYELIKQHCDEWILDVAQPPSAAACHLLLECLLPRLICRAIPAPSTSVARLIHVTKMISWLTIADDEDDHPDALGADDASSAQHARHVMDILCSPVNDNTHDMAEPHQRVLPDHMGCPNQLSNVNSASAGWPMIESKVPQYASRSKSERKEAALSALAKLWAEMQQEMMPRVRQRFVSTMEEYFEATKVQARFRKLHHVPDIDAYMEIRRRASFILPSFVLLEYALCIEVEEDAYMNPLVEKFRTVALDYLCLCNDVISCKAEIGVGDYFNMPSVVYSSSANKEWSFQEAIDHVASMIKDLDEQCVSMLPRIQKSFLPALQGSHVDTYIAALCSCMSGSLAWFLETARYRNPGSSSSVGN